MYNQDKNLDNFENRRPEPTAEEKIARPLGQFVEFCNAILPSVPIIGRPNFHSLPADDAHEYAFAISEVQQIWDKMPVHGTVAATLCAAVRYSGKPQNEVIGMWRDAPSFGMPAALMTLGAAVGDKCMDDVHRLWAKSGRKGESSAQVVMLACLSGLMERMLDLHKEIKSVFRPTFEMMTAAAFSEKSVPEIMSLWSDAPARGVRAGKMLIAAALTDFPMKKVNSMWEYIDNRTDESAHLIALAVLSGDADSALPQVEFLKNRWTLAYEHIAKKEVALQLVTASIHSGRPMHETLAMYDAADCYHEIDAAQLVSMAAVKKSDRKILVPITHSYEYGESSTNDYHFCYLNDPRR